MSKPSKGDWVIFYSAKDKFEDGKTLQKFTGIRQVVDEELFQVNTTENFKPYRRSVKFRDCVETEICPLLEQLSFIKNKKNWGFYLVSGFREICKEDFTVLGKAVMQV